MVRTGKVTTITVWAAYTLPILIGVRVTITMALGGVMRYRPRVREHVVVPVVATVVTSGYFSSGRRPIEVNSSKKGQAGYGRRDRRLACGLD